MTRYIRATSVALSIASEQHVDIEFNSAADNDHLANSGRRRCYTESNSFRNANQTEWGPISTISYRPESKIEEESANNNCTEKTHWISIYLLTAVSLLIGIQYSVYFPSLWPYLNTIDAGAGETFFGLIIATFSAGQAVSSPLFGYWSNRSKSVKCPLICGTLIMTVSNLIYAFVEAFPETKRRWVLLVARAFIGVGAGILGLMRAYSSTASVVDDRARAITLVMGSFVMGMTIGPAVQVAFSPIGSRGVIFSPLSLHINMYTAPAWFAIVANILALVLLMTVFEENYSGIVHNDSAGRKNDPHFLLPKFDKLAAFVCICTQFTLMLIITNLETIGSMYTMAMWDWTANEAVIYLGYMQSGQAFISLLGYLAFGWKLGQIVSNGRERIGTIFGLSLALLFHVITYPYSFWPNSLDYKMSKLVYSNGTELAVDSRGEKVVGCDTDYSWCTSTRRVPFAVFCAAILSTIGLAFPAVNVSMNTLYSKIIGPRRQGTMQGMLLLSGSTARTAGPLLVAHLFDKYGPALTWTVEIVFLTATILLWLVFYTRLVPLFHRYPKHNQRA